jgi:hypothetical protein
MFLSSPSESVVASAASPSMSAVTLDNRLLESRKLGTFDTPLGIDACTQAESKPPCVRLGLLRRGIIHTTTYDAQLTRGRPPPTWSTCGNDDCEKGRYVETDGLMLRRETSVVPKTMPGDPPSAAEYMPTTPIVDVASGVEVFVRNVVKDQFQTKPGSSLYDDLCAQVRSFADAPPVRAALYTFRANLATAGLDPSPRALANLLTRLRGAVVYMVKLPVFCGARNFPWIPPEHTCFRPAGHSRPKGWGLEQFVLEFCTALEAWRRWARREIEGTDWAFMRASAAGDFYLCLLLNEWCMLRNGQLLSERCTPLRMDSVWESWFRRHGRVDLAEVERDEQAQQERMMLMVDGDAGYALAGIGQLEPSWQETRLRALTEARQKAHSQVE